jgi:putative membrane protein
MHNEHIHHFNGNSYELMLSIPFVLLLILYIIATLVSNDHYKRWLLYRTISWGLGVLCIAAIVAGPIAKRAHADFSAHMIGHLLIGMVTPLLIVLSAPMTLLLRSLNVKVARQLSGVLKSFPIRVLSNPIVASVLNVGGLWILYTTDLYSAIHQNIVLYLFIHIHVFFAGYLFTASIIYIDPTPHRTNFIYRAIILVLTSASHGILSKYIYTNPPSGVPIAQAEKGAMLMYYGGDAVDIILIFILCLQWYKSSKTKAFVDKEAIVLHST